MVKAIGGFFSRWFSSVVAVLGDIKTMYKGNRLKVISLISIYFLIDAAFVFVGGLLFGFIFFLSKALYFPLLIAYVAKSKEQRLGNWAWEKRNQKPKTIRGRMFGFVGDGVKTVLKPFLIMFGFLKKLFGNSPVAVALVSFWMIIYVSSLGFFTRFVPELLGPIPDILYERIAVGSSADAVYPVAESWLANLSLLNMTNFYFILPFFTVFTFFVATISMIGFIKALKDGGTFRAVLAYSIDKAITSAFTIIGLLVVYLIMSRLIMTAFFVIAKFFEIEDVMILNSVMLLRELFLGVVTMLGVLGLIAIATKDKPVKAD